MYNNRHICSPVSLRVVADRSGLFAITEVRLLGIGNDGLGLDCIAARACCTASCRTSKIIEKYFVIMISRIQLFNIVKL